MLPTLAGVDVSTYLGKTVERVWYNDETMCYFLVVEGGEKHVLTREALENYAYPTLAAAKVQTSMMYGIQAMRQQYAGLLSDGPAPSKPAHKIESRTKIIKMMGFGGGRQPYHRSLCLPKSN